MGKALQVLTGQVTNPSTTLTALTPNSGDSYTVRSTNMGSPIYLAEAWSFTATAGVLRIRSPRMHDQAQNIRLQTVASQPYPSFPLEGMQYLYSQDPITVEMTGDAAAVDLSSLLVYYSDLPGINARLHTWPEIQPLIDKITVVEVDITSSATSCNYSPQVALNANFDTLIRNQDYAILGYQSRTSGGTFGITGVDTGNLRVAGPLTNLSFFTSDWFVRVSNDNGIPAIPVINSANVAGVLCDVAAQATSTVFNIGVNLALLKSPIGS